MNEWMSFCIKYIRGGRKIVDMRNEIGIENVIEKKLYKFEVLMGEVLKRE